MAWLESPMALVWLTYFSIAELLSLMPSQVSSCVLVSEEASAENYSGNHACASMHEAIFRFVRFIWENANHDNIVAFGTVTVSVFTYTLWRSTNKLWDAAKAQARITENAFAQLEGPVIEGSNVDLSLAMGPREATDRPVAVKFWLKNRGRGPGFITEISGRFVMVPGGTIPTVPEYGEIFSSNTAIAADEEIPHPLEFKLEIPSGDGLMEVGLFFFGYVKYRGIFGGVNTWAWGFMPDNQTGSFTISGGAAYNYRKYEPPK